jgi:diguanylate cyclase (GGDEF)-like protein
LAPDIVLGWPAARLIGTPARNLLAGSGGFFPVDLLDPFQTTIPLHRRRVWLRHAGGAPACLVISAGPVPGKPGAVRGLGFDITAQDRDDAHLGASLLQRETARLVARRMRRVALPFASLTIALAELISAVGAQGATLVLHDPDAPLRVAAKAGLSWPGPIQALHDAILESCGQPPGWLQEHAQQSALCGQSLLLCGTTNHFTNRAILAVWREGAAWSAEETALAAALLPPMQPILEHEQIQRETARLSRIDILTSLFNRQGFIAELPRRFERLDREGLPATLMVVGLDGLEPINAQHGLETGDTVLRNAAKVLRDVVRPTDLVARLGGDLFALWLDGADQFAGAERAEGLRRTGIPTGGPFGDAAEGRLSVSIGLAIRDSRSFESIDSLLHRAWNVMRAIKLAGGGRWQVSNQEPSP